MNNLNILNILNICTAELWLTEAAQATVD